MSMPLTLKFLLICFFSSYFLTRAVSESLIKRISPCTNSTNFSKKVKIFAESSAKVLKGSIKLESFQGSQVILRGNSTITSENKTFRLGFFAPNDEFRWYLGIWYASIPISTYAWVANREKPIKNLLSASAEITEDGKLAVMDQDSRTIMWETNNVEKANDLRLLEQGNLVLLSSDGRIVWRSFDFPTDTWLPGMNLTAEQRLTSWKSSIDPAPGRYSLRLNPPDYGEIALFYSNGSADMITLYTYWTTGKWNGNAFAGVPEMTIPYIYRFDFIDPFTPMATFGYTEVPLESGIKPPLTRFVLDHVGQLKQFTWSQQSEVWNMFWSQPENVCRVYGLCGNLGFCNGKPLSPCQCLNGFRPVDIVSWGKDDFSEGCWREGGETCGENDKFEEVGAVSYERTSVVSFSGGRSECESACLQNCSCIALDHNANNNLCKNLYGSLLNLHNLTSDSTIQDKLYVRVQTTGAGKKNKKKTTLLIGMICGILVILSIGTINLYLRRTKVRRRKGEEDGVFQVTNLRVFSYRELYAATRGFSVKLGHGGFGAVFQGVLSDSSAVAVKRLERPGGGEKEFRAEVCTIGNIQHVNLVRLRGFCSENSHRLLVYDFMPNGPLSMYLRHGSQNLSWDVRFRVAVGTARGIAYLHEECRNCIIHCDIKPENILLDEDFSAKVSDFGLAKLIGRDFSRVLATMRGTWGYVAPEWISGVAITTKADVYSYGMTLLELLGGRRNVEGPPSACGGGECETEKWFFPPWAARQIIEGNVAAVVDERLGSMYNEAEAGRLGLVAVWCIQDDESTRPTMGMVVKMLEGVVEVTVPPPPKLLQALVSGESFQGVGAESGERDPQEDAGSFDDNVSIYIDSKDSKLSL
ncbi:hypothetical protein Pfo_001182 [Paulownia fortunei]|nr:hypothetical protein Pfo_001182 [Paulownia fortunei]